MPRFLVALSVFVFMTAAFCASVQAAGPRCGAIDRYDIDEIFDAADDVRYLYNVEDDLKESCALAERLEAWEDAVFDGRKPTKAYKDRHKALHAEMKQIMMSMKSPLKRLYIWAREDADSTIERARRLHHIREARSELKDAQKRLEQARKELSGLMTRSPQ